MITLELLVAVGLSRRSVKFFFLYKLLNLIFNFILQNQKQDVIMAMKKAIKKGITSSFSCKGSTISTMIAHLKNKHSQLCNELEDLKKKICKR